MAIEHRYHAFIAYASADRAYAKSLYEILRLEYEVFFDWECLLPGDPWDTTLPKAQANSLTTVVLISSNVDEAYYQQEEIASAIALSRSSASSHRVIPVYIDKDVIKDNVPYGLRRLHSIFLDDSSTIVATGKMIGRVLNEMPHVEILRRSPINLQEDRLKTISSAESERNMIIDKVSDIVLNSLGKSLIVSLIYLDLDSFSGLNKRYGISVGNEVVKTVMKIMNKYCDKHLFRWGGDSYLACFENKLDEVFDIGKKIRKEIYAYDWETIAPRLYVSASLGVVELDDCDDSNSFILRAKEGARLAKKKGGNKVVKGPLSAGRHSRRDSRHALVMDITS